jgi:hypothetical protein
MFGQKDMQALVIAMQTVQYQDFRSVSHRSDPNSADGKSYFEPGETVVMDCSEKRDEKWLTENCYGKGWLFFLDTDANPLVPRTHVYCFSPKGFQGFFNLTRPPGRLELSPRPGLLGLARSIPISEETRWYSPAGKANLSYRFIHGALSSLLELDEKKLSLWSFGGKEKNIRKRLKVIDKLLDDLNDITAFIGVDDSPGDQEYGTLQCELWFDAGIPYWWVRKGILVGEEDDALEFLEYPSTTAVRSRVRITRTCKPGPEDINDSFTHTCTLEVVESQGICQEFLGEVDHGVKAYTRVQVADVVFQAEAAVTEYSRGKLSTNAFKRFQKHKRNCTTLPLLKSNFSSRPVPISELDVCVAPWPHAPATTVETQLKLE